MNVKYILPGPAKSMETCLDPWGLHYTPATVTLWSISHAGMVSLPHHFGASDDGGKG